MSVYLVISLPKIPYIHRIYMVLANPINNTYGVYALFLAGKSPHITYTVIHIAYIRFWPTLDTALTTTHTHTHHTHPHTHTHTHTHTPFLLCSRSAKKRAQARPHLLNCAYKQVASCRRSTCFTCCLLVVGACEEGGHGTQPSFLLFYGGT